MYLLLRATDSIQEDYSCFTINAKGNEKKPFFLVLYFSGHLIVFEPFNLYLHEKQEI